MLRYDRREIDKQIIIKMNYSKFFNLCILIVSLFINFNCKNKEKGDRLVNFSIKKHINNIDDDSINCTCRLSYNVKDSNDLIHVKNQFYTSNSGHLYEKTWRVKELKDEDTLSWALSFNGSFFQDLDPETFFELNGWYAKDKNFVYHCRPTSGGMRIIKIDKADSRTFELLKGCYNYAKDKNNFYEDINVIEGFPVKKSIIYTNLNNKAFKISFLNNEYKFVNWN